MCAREHKGGGVHLCVLIIIISTENPPLFPPKNKIKKRQKTEPAPVSKWIYVFFIKK